jgi:hypothetical protein
MTAVDNITSLRQRREAIVNQHAQVPAVSIGIAIAPWRHRLASRGT